MMISELSAMFLTIQMASKYGHLELNLYDFEDINFLVVLISMRISITSIYSIT